MGNLANKKLLILGGKPIGSIEIVQKAKSMGIYTIVADYLPVDESPAKRIADEAWDASTADLELLEQKAKEAKVDGVYTGVHEFNIRQMIQLCDRLHLPCYCTLEQWDRLENKIQFKNLCKQYQIPVTRDFKITDEDDCAIADEDFPVIVKPSDGSGSRGFSICRNRGELKAACCAAKEFSDSREVLVETFMDYRFSVIINYTIVDGEVFFSGISDKRSRKVFEHGAPIMSFQFYPSEYETDYLQTLDRNAREMLRSTGLRNGVVWIEAFCKNGRFVFNEIGYRFGGSLTYYPVQYFFEIDQLELQIEYALTGQNGPVTGKQKQKEGLYCILPTHVKPGKIAKVSGISELKRKDYLRAFVPVHFEGDMIQNWGSAQQVFAYIHYSASDREDARKKQEEIMNTFSLADPDGNELLFNLVDENVF